MKTDHWRSWLAAAAILLLGVALGSVGTSWVDARLRLRTLVMEPASVEAAKERAAVRIGAELSDELQLTPEQSQAVTKIIKQAEIGFNAIRTQAREQAVAELRKVTADIAATLPPDKRPAFYKRVAKRYERLGLPPPQPAAP